jgi:hypothetical protein
MAATLSLDPAACLTLRMAIAWLLLSAAVHKVRDFGAFRAALTGYALVPSRAVAAASVLLIGLELVVGVGLVLPGEGRGASLAALGLVSTYTAGRVPLSGGLIGRNTLVMAAAVVATLPVSARSLVWLDAVTVAAGTATLGLLYTTADTALANALRLAALSAVRGGTRLSSPATLGGSP